MNVISLIKGDIYKKLTDLHSTVKNGLVYDFS